MTDNVLLLDIGAAPPAATTPVVMPEGDWMPKPYTAPAVPAPTGVVTAPVADGVMITWDAVSLPNVIYIVERAPQVAGAPGAWVEVARTTDARYTYTQATGGVAYYRIRAEARGAPSAPSSDPEPQEPVRVSLIAEEVIAVGAAVDAEVAARIAGDAAEASARASALAAESAARAAAITNEANARTAAITAEASARTSAISAAVAAEASARGAAILSEQTARQDADTVIAANLVATAAEINNRRAFAPFRTYNFDTNADGWVTAGTGATLTHMAPGFVRHLRGTGLSRLARDMTVGERIDGARNPVVRIRFRTANGLPLVGRPFYFGTVAGIPDESRKKLFDVAAGTGWQVVELDMTGVADWESSPVTHFRLFIPTVDGQHVDVDWISVGAYGQPTSAEQFNATTTAVQSLESRATSIEGVNTVQGSSITQLQSDMTAANGQIALKASAAALSALDSRVTSAEGTLSSQGTSLTSLTNTINHPTTGLASRASSAALSALDSRVTSAEGTLSSQGTSIASLTNTINHPTTGLTSRASSAALSALDSRVAATESSVSSQSTSITNLTNELAGLSADARLLKDGGFEDSATWKNAANFSVVTDSGTARTGMKYLRIDAGTAGQNIANLHRFACKVGERFTLAFSCGAVGSTAPNGYVRLSVRWYNSAGAYVSFNSSTASRETTASRWLDVVGDITAPAGVAYGEIVVQTGHTAGAWAVDDVRAERVSDGALATSNAISSLDSRVTGAEGTISSQGSSLTALNNTISNPTTGLASRASTAALSALDSRVTSTESSLATQATAITSVQASLAGLARVNNPSFEQTGGWGSSANGTGSLPAGVAYTTTIKNSGARALQVDSNGTTRTIYNTASTLVKPGQRVRVGGMVRHNGTAPNGTTYIGAQFRDVAGALISGGNINVVMSGSSITSTFTSRSNIGDVPAGAVSVHLYVQISNGATTGGVVFDDLDIEVLGEDLVGAATATQSLDVRATLLEAGQAVLQAQYVLSVDVNGRVGGMRLANNGTQVDLQFLADTFKLVNPSGADSLTWENGVMVARSGAYMKVTGKGFGVGSALIEWYGPVMAISACSTSNSLYHMTKTGSAYFGGTLSAGTLHSAGRWNLNATNWTDGTYATCTHVGSNGAPKTIVVSAMIAHLARYAGNAVASYPARTGAITVGLFRGATELARWTVTATSGATFYPLEPGNPDSNYTENAQSWNFGSQTITDTISTAGDIGYTLKVITSSGSRYDPTTGLFTISVTE